MVTLAQIDELHARLGRADTLAEYVRGLAALGVTRVDSLVPDGRSEYTGAGGRRVVSPAHHEVLTIAATRDREACVRHLRLHAAGETDYVEMSRGLADSGVERWVIDTAELTMTYLDRLGQPLLVEAIE